MDTKWTMWRNHASAQDSINAWIGRCTKPWSGTQWTHVRYFRLSFSLVFFSKKKKKFRFQIILKPWVQASSLNSGKQFNSVPWPIGVSGGSWGTIQQRSSILFCGRLWHRQGCPLLDIVHPAFPLPTTVLPTLQGALKDGSGEAVAVYDMPKPGKFLLCDCKRAVASKSHADTDACKSQFFPSTIPG